MNPVPEGTRIRVRANSNDHHYTIGAVYAVTHDDRDGTFKAADAAGQVGDWLLWEDCEPAGPSAWDRIAADLPDDLVRFLSCFDGIQGLTLKESIADAMLSDVPDLHERIVALANAPESEAMIAGNRPHVDHAPAAAHEEAND